MLQLWQRTLVWRIVFANFRDFSRFSEDWPGSVVVGFGSVTLSSSSLTKQLKLGALARVRAPCPRLLYSVQDRSMPQTNDLDRRGERARRIQWPPTPEHCLRYSRFGPYLGPQNLLCGFGYFSGFAWFHCIFNPKCENRGYLRTLQGDFAKNCRWWGTGPVVLKSWI